ncbi:hypothetical protein [Spiroplasma endosymbiont of Nebria brevicollis]
MKNIFKLKNINTISPLYSSGFSTPHFRDIKTSIDFYKRIKN